MDSTTRYRPACICPGDMTTMITHDIMVHSGIPVSTPLDNIRAMVAAGREE